LARAAVNVSVFGQLPIAICQLLQSLFNVVATETFRDKKAIQFRSNLLRWFGKEQRALPWRETKDPYRILVSEIMLQQTRVAVVEDRYKKFLKQFPTAKQLARAQEQTVLAAWSGLGYYRRARNLRAAAKKIVSNGGFPQSAATLQELPGVGRYTAAAVASIAFGEPVAVVDGNVKRVLRRIAGRNLPDEACWRAAEQLLARNRPSDFNQAMMELGALVCLPGVPLCGRCPVARQCISRGAMAKTKSQARLKASVHHALSQRNGSIYLQQREKSASLMPGMWELPVRKSYKNEVPLLTVRHAITTTDYTVHVFKGPASLRGGRWVSLRSIEKLPLTGLTRKILQKLELLP
jgi:A/G-specific adenine glycosylase